MPGALLYLAAVGLLRNAAGGFASGAGALAFIPVFQITLYRRRRSDLGWVLVGVALFFVLPTILIGGAAYPSSQYRTTVLVVAVNGIIGAATMHLVQRVREQAEEAEARERRAERVTAVIHSLHDSPAACEDVCAAARTIADAEGAFIYEPRPDGSFVCTALAGLDAGDREIVAGPRSAVIEAFTTGRPVLIEGNAAERVGSRALWEQGGCPDVLLYEPLRRAGETLGVLVVAWARRSPSQSGRTTLVALLAQEAAAVIARADAFADLAGQARTDALTGLPNRRAWDLALAQTAAPGVPMVVAILDLDHFKAFNDTHGHPAGDHLLKAAAAGWRDQLRGSDLLARIGGEEFALLLAGDDTAQALEVVSRLRRVLPMGATASAGLAIRDGDEPVESVLERADAALYEAKTRGRDRACISRERRSPRDYVEVPVSRAARSH